MALTRKQTAVLHLAKKELRLSDDDYRAILSHVGGAESSRDLTMVGFYDEMDQMARFGFRSTWLKRTYGNRPGMATPSQVDFIRELWRRYCGGNGDGHDLDRWLERSYGVSALRFLDEENAAKAITGLKVMVKRPRKTGKKGAAS